MKEIFKVEMNLDDYLNPKIYFQSVPGNDNEWLSLDDVENRGIFIENTKCNPLLADALIALQEEISETLKAIRQDMADLYKEIKALKEQIKR